MMQQGLKYNEIENIEQWATAVYNFCVYHIKPSSRKRSCGRFFLCTQLNTS